MNEPQDTRDVVEYVVATFLGACAVALATWLGKRYLDVDPHNGDTININLDKNGECDCPECRRERKAEKKARKAQRLAENTA